MNPQILLIEGEETQAISVQRILEPAGYEVVWATTLQGVIDFLNQAERPVVVSSLGFTQLDVFSLLRWLVVNRPQARLLILLDDVAPPTRANGALSFVSVRSLSRLSTLISDALGGILPAVSFADLIDVLSLLVLTKSTQRLHVVFDQQQGYLYIWQGQLLHAQTDTQAGLGAFSEILGWTGGGVYELAWENPPEQSLLAGEAEAMLLGSRQKIEPSSEGLLSILEDAVEDSLDAEPAPELAPQEATFSPITQDFVPPEEAAPQTPEWPNAAPAQIAEAIQEPTPEAPQEQAPDAPSSQPTADEPAPQSQAAAPEEAPDAPEDPPSDALSTEENGALHLRVEPDDDESAPQAPVTTAEVLLNEPSDEAIPAAPSESAESAAHAPSDEEQLRALEQSLTEALREDASKGLQRYESPSQAEQSKQNILAQEVLLGNSPLTELLREPSPQPMSNSRRLMESIKADDIASSEMEEASVEEMGALIELVKEEDQSTGEDVWAELSQEMEAVNQPTASPFEPPKQAPLSPPQETASPAEVALPAETAPVIEATPPAAVKPFLQTPSYRETHAPTNLAEHAPTEPDLEVTQTPPLGMRIPSRMTAHTQPYNIAPSTPPRGVPIVPTSEEVPAEIRTPPMGTRIMTPPKTPALGIPIHYAAHATPPAVAPVPFIPPPATNGPRTSPTLNNSPRPTNSGSYPTARTPSGMYRAVPSAEVESNMFSDYLTPPFGMKIPKTPNAEQTPLAPTGSPLASAARSALIEKAPAVLNGPIADLVPVLEGVAREVPEFVAAVAFETDSGMTLGGVTNRADLDAEGGFAYYAEVLRLLRPSISLFDASFEELLVTSPKWYILVRPLREEFFLGLITTRRGNLGICRIVLKRAATQLLERLPAKENKAP